LNYLEFPSIKILFATAKIVITISKGLQLKRFKIWSNDQNNCSAKRDPTYLVLIV